MEYLKNMEYLKSTIKIFNQKSVEMPYLRTFCLFQQGVEFFSNRPIHTFSCLEWLKNKLLIIESIMKFLQASDVIRDPDLYKESYPC